MTGPIFRDTLRQPYARELLDWLEENADPATLVAPGYTVDDLTDDLIAILDREWSDGIDAMGEDA